MRILVADRLPTYVEATMRAAGHECVIDPGLTEATLPEAVGGVEILVVRSTEVTADAFGAADSLRLVVRAGSGTNTIDCDEASRPGVLVANVPGRNSIAVAELTMALLLAVDRAIPDNMSELRAGHWDKKRFSAVGRGLYGRLSRHRRPGPHRPGGRRAGSRLRPGPADAGQGPGAPESPSADQGARHRRAHCLTWCRRPRGRRPVATPAVDRRDTGGRCRGARRAGARDPDEHITGEVVDAEP